MHLTSFLLPATGAVHSLGLEAPPSAIDALFDTFERDEGGGIRYKELCRELRREAEGEAKPATRDPRPFSTGVLDVLGTKISSVLKPSAPAARASVVTSEFAAAPATASALSSNDAATGAITGTGAEISTSTSAGAGGKCRAPSKGKQQASGRPDERDSMIWELFSLLEMAAPWAVWQVAERMGSLSDLAARTSAGPSPTERPKPLPPVRSTVADGLSCVALGMVCRSTYIQLAVVDSPRDSLMALAPLHGFVGLVWLWMLLTLLRQLCSRLLPSAVGPVPTPSLPLHTANAAIASSAHAAARKAPPFAHWTTIALCELLLASYAACWASPLQPLASPSSKQIEAEMATAEALVLARRLGSAHTLAAGSAGLLITAAAWRALLMFLWRGQCLPWSLSSIGNLPTAAPSVQLAAKLAPTAPSAARPAEPAKPTAVSKALAACCKKVSDLLKQLTSPKSSGAGGKRTGAPGRGSAVAPGVSANKGGRPAGRSATPPRSGTPSAKRAGAGRRAGAMQMM